MACCEKCWDDAFLMSITTGRSQTECYYELIEERNQCFCSTKEQAGEYWDEKTQSRRR